MIDVKIKHKIDCMSYYQLLKTWRFVSCENSMFEGETGRYYARVMAKRRCEIGEPEHVRVSKLLGFDGQKPGREDG